MILVLFTQLSQKLDLQRFTESPTLSSDLNHSFILFTIVNMQEKCSEQKGRSQRVISDTMLLLQDLVLGTGCMKLQ